MVSLLEVPSFLLCKTSHKYMARTDNRSSMYLRLISTTSFSKCHGSCRLVPIAAWFLNSGENIAASTQRHNNSGVTSAPNPPISVPQNENPLIPDYKALWNNHLNMLPKRLIVSRSIR